MKYLLTLCLLSSSLFCSAAESNRPLVVAHRGLLRHAPENTLANFRACLELRIGFEFDVYRTKDGHLICIHDTTVDRTTDGTGRVADLTLDQVRQLDAGSWFDANFAGQKVPTIEEVLALIAQYRQHRILIAVDLKSQDVEQDVVRLAQQHNVLERLLFIGRTISEPAVRRNIRQAAPQAHTAAVANNTDEFATALAEPDADWVYVRFLPSADQLKAVHSKGKRAFIAGPTVSGHLPENWHAVTQSGIDAILTDYALILQSQLLESTARHSP
jgi:glycerophosphoryl diester phosphodiesterase